MYANAAKSVQTKQAATEALSDDSDSDAEPVRTGIKRAGVQGGKLRRVQRMEQGSPKRKAASPKSPPKRAPARPAKRERESTAEDEAAAKRRRKEEKRAKKAAAKVTEAYSPESPRRSPRLAAKATLS